MDQTLQNTLSFRSKLESFLIFNGIFLFIIAFNVALLYYGLFCYPSEVALYVALPYYTYCKVLTRQEMSRGVRWERFSKDFFLFPKMREFLSLQFRSPNSNSFAKAEASKDAQFVIAVFPHGTAADYRVAMDGVLDQVFPNIYTKIRTLGASILFVIPVVREFFLWTSGIDARRAVAENAINDGYSLLVLPGGEQEQIRTVYQKERVFLKRRKGFLKLAMSKGVPVIPVYVFGASDYYRTYDAFLGIRLWLVKNLGICIPFSVGLWGSILCPLPVKTVVAVGEPMSFEKKNPSADELDVAHKSFCKALVDLFDEHKESLGYADRSLEIM